MTGMHAMRFLSDVNIDIAFLSPSGLSLKSGFTGGNYSECELKRVVVEKARLVVLLLDSSKIDKSLPYTFCQLDQVHIIITDTPLPDDITEQIHRHGGRIIDVTKEQ